MAGLVTSDASKDVLLNGDVRALLHERLRARGIDYHTLSFQDLESAVAAHVDAGELYGVLKAASAAQPLIDYGWFTASGRATRGDPGARLRGTRSAEALYWALDGDVEHVDAFMRTLDESNANALSEVIAQMVASSDSVEQFRASLDERLESVFDELVCAGFRAVVMQLAFLLDHADRVNAITRESMHVQRMRKRYERVLVDEFIESGSSELYDALLQLDVLDAVLERVNHRVVLAINHGQEVSRTLMRAVAQVGVTPRAYEHLRLKNEMGALRLHPAVHDLFSSREPKDWEYGFSLVDQMDRIRSQGGADDGACRDEARWHVRARIAQLDVHDGSVYALGILAGLGDQVSWQAAYTTQRMASGAVPAADIVDPHVLSELIFGGEGRGDGGCHAAQALRAVDNIATPSRVLQEDVRRAYVLLGREGFSAGRTHPAVARVAKHYGLVPGLIENAVRHAVQNRMILTELVDVARAEDYGRASGERLEPLLLETYRTCAEEIVSHGAPGDVQLYNAMEFARRYGVSEGFVESGLESSALKKEMNVGLIHLANAMGLTARAQEWYAPMVEGLVYSDDVQKRSVGAAVAELLQLPLRR